MESAKKAVRAERRILLVEDDESHAELIKRAFEDRPAIILTVAHRIDQAIRALQEGMPDMVIADLRLPDGRGIDLCRGKDFPIVIMTSQGSEGDAVEAMRAGALDYIVKSDLMFSELPHVVDRAMREWELERAHARATRQLQSQYEVASALATSVSLEQAGTRILESICHCVEWPLGELWRVDEQAEVLRRVAFYATETAIVRVETEGGEPVFARGEGLPGTTWAKGAQLSILHPEDAPAERRRPVISRLGLRCGYGFPIRTSDGRIFALFSFYAQDIGHPNGDIERLLSTISAQLDVFAERQREQEERRRLQRELVDRERLAAVGETAATLAHEIGNPLNSMYMHAQLLQRRLARLPDVDPKITQGLEVLLAENVRLTNLLHDFRSLSRRNALTLVPTDMNDLLDELFALEQPLLDMGAVEVVREIPPGLPTILGDASKLKQVFMNLVKNAIEAMPTGGRLTVTATTDEQRLLIDFTDTGAGLPEGIDVFEAFQTTKAAGTGLGLPVARQVLAAHEGTIGCSSTPGGGTTFRVVLPLHRRG
ncbi:ATP-binding protein [Paraliomyxa miuraensis]|uniref:ATP-binding protein n=1 Tax=Paraliomyxa miuraensis TaxID=376150 RepID=UPI00224F6403|nr:ATP-binding protein [Paraliomyxa miuraensis]MCX4247290.1 ATP-binding protein [Paraliomyxa miuraensis]